MNKHWLLVLLLFAALPLSAQQTDFLHRSELLLGGGGMFYIGDLNNQSVFSAPRGAFDVGLRCRLDNRWSLRAAVSHGSVECAQDYQEQRNLSFRSAVSELSGVVEFDFRPYGPGATESLWTPYLFGGIGVFHYNPKASYTDLEGNEQWVALQPLRTEGQGSAAYPDRRLYRLTQLCIPFGLGVRCRLGKNFSIAAEYGFRKTWTDYLDDVSTTYVGADLLRSNANTTEDGEMAVMLADRTSEVVADYVNAPGIKRGDDSLDDWYSYVHVNIGINLDFLLGWARPKRCKF